MKYHTRTKWTDGSVTVSESSFKSIKEAAEHVVSEGDFTDGHVYQLFGLFEDDNGAINGFAERTPHLKAACYEYWLDKYDANYCDYTIALIDDLVDARFMFDGEFYVIRKGME